MSETALDFDALVRDARQVREQTVLGICASAKPTVTGSQSACRSYLNFMLNKLIGVYPSVLSLDLAEIPLPFFDGHAGETSGIENAIIAVQAVRRAGALLMAVPAYWNSVGGVFKNFCDVIGGAAYDQTYSVVPFEKKPVGLLIVGADHESTLLGGEHATVILRSLGAQLVSEPVLVENPRNLSPKSLAELTPRLVELAVACAKAACSNIGTR